MEVLVVMFSHQRAGACVRVTAGASCLCALGLSRTFVPFYGEHGKSGGAKSELISGDPSPLRYLQRQPRAA